MKNTAIIIPTRLGAKRFPNKPLAKINNVPMIIHVLNKAKESQVGEVIIATPDNEIFDIVKKNGGQVILTQNNHLNGTSRVFEAFKKLKDTNVDLIMNLQGDNPILKPRSISKLEKLMRKNKCPIGTLASSLNEDEIYDENVVKVEVDEDLKEGYKHLLKNKRMEGINEPIYKFNKAFHSFIFK
jgi:3-deoxy-manno-octulosonate cytidylyltransferase (CMP-KDO synthetase)